MSQAVSYKEFCQRHELDPSTEEAAQEYAAYRENLCFVNAMFAEKETEEAIERIKKP